MTTPRSAAKALARFAMHRLGMIQAFLWYRRSSFQILTYHRFTDVPTVDPAEVLTRQCAFIREHFNPVSVSQVEHALHRGAPLPPNALAITVDDGYRDFLTVAFPIFRAHKLPVTVYLISGFLDGELWPWWDQLAWALQHSRKPYVEDEVACPSRLTLGSEAERQTASLRLIDCLVKLPNRDRVAFMDRLPETLAVDIPAAPPEQYAAMTWDEVRKLQHEGIEFGAHTHTHPILTSLESAEAVKAELAQSKRRIEEELRSPVTHFCYPNGDFNDMVVAAVKACGFLSATTVLSGYDSRATDPYLLRRHSLEMDLSDYYFRESLAGLH